MGKLDGMLIISVKPTFKSVVGIQHTLRKLLHICLENVKIIIRKSFKSSIITPEDNHF